MRRSSSRQRGSALPDRSIAPPVDQKRFQWLRVVAAASSKSGAAAGREPGENATTAASAVEPGAAASR